MGAQLTLRWASQVASAIGDLGPRYVNKTGTAIKSMERRDLGENGYVAAFNGQLIAGLYTLTFNAAGTLCYVNAQDGTKNEWNDPTGVTIVSDGTTTHDLVVPGLRLVFNVGTSDTDESLVSIGSFLDATPFSQRALNAGPVKNDDNAYAFRVGIKNIGDADAVNIALRPVPALYYTNTDAEKIMARIGPHSSTSRDQLAPAGGYSLSFQNWVNAGSYYTADVYRGSNLGIATAKFDGETIYQHGKSNGYVDSQDILKGLQAVFAKISADPTSKTVSVQVREGWSWAVLALDSGGNPTTYQNSQLAVSDLMIPGAEVFVWLGVRIPLGQARGSMRLWTPKLMYEEV